MSVDRSRRRRVSEQGRETRRRTDSIAEALGRDVRAERKRRRLTQRELAGRLGIHQSRLSQIELGRGQGVPLETWVAIGVELDRPCAISLTRPLGQPSRPVDDGHLEVQEYLLSLARDTGRIGVAEMPTRPGDPWHSVDVATRDDRHHVVVLQEAWNTFGDIGAAIRSTHRKVADLEAGPEPHRIAVVWVVRSSAANRAIVARFRNVFAASFDGSSRAWVRALTTDAGPPDRPGLVWFDPATRRITAWRRRGGG